MKQDNYYKELPSGYIEKYVIDAKSKKTAIAFTVLSLVMFAIPMGLLAIRIIKLNNELPSIDSTKFLIADISFLIGMVLYIVLHELTHGLLYKIETGEKLTYGFTLTVAFCGVPSIYVKKKSMMLTILAPFVVYTVLFGILLVIFRNNFYALLTVSLLFSLHISGCVGDLYGAMVMAFKFKGKDLLVNDTGPKQTFYVKE